ncbi:MAG: metal-dependent hydrolase, partial [Rhodospirillales bacterium]|nr:metal-dependent hydrolase [Rhodospirillales bacterium]
MDPFTHLVLGATVAQTGFRRGLGRRAVILGGLVATLPDIDVVAGLGGLFANWQYHRGVTHSVLWSL